MGVVYEAVGDHGEVVALKVLLPHLAGSPATVERFLREGRMGSRLHHDHVVRTLDVGRADHGGATWHYLVMERVEGESLADLLREMRTLPEALLREIARQIAAGLAALHEVGIVHRDLKPENLLIAPDRRVRIADLGIAKSDRASTSLTEEGQFVGSLRYASPEQCDGRDATAASDLYSLGVVLYELAAGRPPFDDEGALALLRHHLETLPVPVAERNPQVSDFLAEVIGSLLAKRPEERFPSAGELARVLEEGEQSGWWKGRRPRAPRPAATTTLPRATRLVGRDAERRAIEDAWNDARRGAGSVVLVSGAAGLGKTRLVEEHVRAVAGGGAWVATSSFARAAGHGALADALTGLLGDEIAGALERLGLPPGLAASFAASIGRSSAPGATPLPADAFDAVLARVVETLSADAPLLWVADDVHAADAAALRSLLAIARAVEGRPAMLLATTRPEPAAPAFLASIAALPSSRRVDLSRLDDESVVALVTDALRDPVLGRRVGERIAPRADGVPLFVLEILAEMERRGHLVRDDDGAWTEARSLSRVEIPGALRDLVRARLAHLGAEERATLDAAAVEGVEFDPDLVARVRGVQKIAVLEVLGRLERVHGLVRSGPRLVRFDHPLVQEVLYEDLPPALRAEAHGRLSEALATLPEGAAGAERSTRVVHHALRGPQPARALPLAVDVVSRLDRLLRPEEAVDLGRRALALAELGPSRERVELLVRVGRCATQVGRRDEARTLLEEGVALADRLEGDDLRARARTALAVHLLSVGEHERALVVAEAAEAAAAEAGAPGAAVEAGAMRGQALWCLGRQTEARACHEGLLHRARAAGDLANEARSSSDLGVVLHEMGFLPEAEGHLRNSIALFRTKGNRRNEDTAVSNLGNVLHDLGRKAEAIACYEGSIATCRDIAFLEGEAVARLNLGEARARLGDFARARDSLRVAEAICAQTGSRRVAGYVHHSLGTIAYWEGDREEARGRLERALALRRETGHRPGVAETVLALGALDQDEGRVDDAIARFEEARAIADDVADVGVSVLAAIRRAALPGGDVSAAVAAHVAGESRLRHDARLESRVLLWRITRDPTHLAAARSLLEFERAHAPPELRSTMVELVPHLREVAATG